MPEPGDLAALPAGSLFHDRYQVVRCIKAGGMGAVYEVIHLETRRRRALKVMLPSTVEDADLRARFKLEATVAAEIESEHIVETFDAGIDASTGTPFLVMELLRGEDLGSLLKRRGTLASAEVVLFLSQAARALDKTHAAGIVHRDLKPDNLFVSSTEDGSPRVKILDFGIAKVVSESASMVKQTRTVGTPLYMSPEQIQGDGRIGPAADLYALAHIAYTLLVGSPYWKEEWRANPALYSLILKIMQGVREPPSVRARRLGVALPSEFDGWFAKGTALAAQHRFGRASELVSALASALGVAGPRASLVTDAGAASAASAVGGPPSAPARAAEGAGPRGTLPPAGLRPSNSGALVLPTGAPGAAARAAAGGARPAWHVVAVGLLALMVFGAGALLLPWLLVRAPAPVAATGVAPAPVVVSVAVAVASTTVTDAPPAGSEASPSPVDPRSAAAVASAPAGGAASSPAAFAKAPAAPATPRPFAPTKPAPRGLPAQGPPPSAAQAQDPTRVR